MSPMTVTEGGLEILGDETDEFLAIKVVTRIRLDVNGGQNGGGIGCWGNLLSIFQFRI